MPVQNIWWWSARPWVDNETQTWSLAPAPIQPAQTVYAFAAMQRVQPVNYGGFAAFAGISSYTINGVNQPVGENQPNGVVPGIFDNNVDSVTFTYGLSAPRYINASMDDQLWVDFTFQIFGWG